MTEEEFQQVLDEAFAFLQAELPELETEGIGGTLMARLASLTNGFYDALRRRVDKQQALSLTRDVAWRIYAKTGRVPWVMSGLRTKKDAPTDCAGRPAST